ncbi:MAG: FISUMP domain-containing protein, partial [Bacteroidales bacterium]
MRKFIILYLLIFVITKTYSQSYYISFIGTGATTNVDSVKVENLTQGIKMTVLGTDTLHLGLVGINEHTNYEDVMIYPNPMQRRAEISFYAEASGDIHIIIYDINGKEIVKSNNFLEQGIHQYLISGLQQGMYFIHIIANNFFYTTKLLSQSVENNEATLEYLGREKVSFNTIPLKNTNSNFDMAYTAGDNLRFTAYSGILSTIVTDVPTSSKTISFTFIASIPTLTTTDISNITANSANSGGNITADGGASITARGICFSTSPNPTNLNNLINSGNGTGVYISNLTALTSSTTYYVRAFATNNAGTAYGNQVVFSTLSLLPSVSTAPATAITASTATSGGNVISDGGASVTARGICYSNFTNPTTSDYLIACGSGTASFTASLTALTANTTYYARAYAINSIGTAYGNEVNFTTLISIPTIITSAASSVSYTSAVSGGNITADGGASITARGICYSTSVNPTIADSVISSGSGTAAFTSNISGLTAGTSYYVRAFATNSIGTAYGNLINFTTLQYAALFYDIDGNAYDTVHIGTQIWMKQNLKTTKFRNGDAIPNYTSNSTYSNLTTAAYSNYNNDTNTSSTYGKLYNWYTVADNRGLCPTG